MNGVRSIETGFKEGHYFIARLADLALLTFWWKQRVDGLMKVEQWWNDTDRGKLKYWEKNIIQCGW